MARSLLRHRRGKLEHDNIAPEDRDLLRALALRLQPHAVELAADWAEAWAEALPGRDADPDAYRQMVGYLARQSVEAVIGFLATRDLEGLYDFQYRNNREGAARCCPALRRCTGSAISTSPAAPASR